jgi:hypothetical protein
MTRKKKELDGPRWLKLKEVLKNSQVKSFGITELDVVRWAKQEKICCRILDGRKKYDVHEVIGFALALSNGWVLGDEEFDETLDEF